MDDLSLHGPEGMQQVPADLLGPMPADFVFPPARGGQDHAPTTGGFDDPAKALARELFPELDEWWPLLERLCISSEEALSLASRARMNGTEFHCELMVCGRVEDEHFYRALADELGLAYVGDIDPNRLVVREADATEFLGRRSWHIPVKVTEKDGSLSFLLAPERLSLGKLRRIVGGRARMLQQLKITTPAHLRKAILVRFGDGMARRAASALFERYPQFSARIVANAWQGIMAGCLMIALPVAFAIASGATFFAMHCFFSLFFLGCVGLRVAATLPAPAVRATRDASAVNPADLPVYSVLVALYREADVVPGLVEALGRLVWPHSKLEIKFVCEEDDVETLMALRSCRLPPFMEIVAVPVFGPRTKPKALAYSLPLTTGELVALYDAEDHPHPLQLMEAWQAFRDSPQQVACVQAPLEIFDRSGSMISRMFAFEYAALFRGLLPWLARRKLLLPLGGTSNHFRRKALDDVGGWDPFNVTEDADLGLRLARCGYRTGTINSPTFEAAPDKLKTWIPQRTRWFKGWLQTWLVHMRQPVRLMRDLGLVSFVIAQILFAGLVASALFHPVLLLTAAVLAADMALARPEGPAYSALFAIDAVNIALGYASFLLLGWQTLEGKERHSFWKVILFTPVYWVMMSWAAWRAVLHLWRQPHLWEKTPHSRVLPPEQQADALKAASSLPQ